ncbi:putative DCC family thiol-disulfide oxidoreductase YuxK [Evansella vedderi]|uniref:DCC family thiol-disulfide oxidoreductase YuxK n=1 Tax=Evansella vedderi TaxID=38282 RepID=A0ABT9ZZ33_9BACI|nr:thiol-disulfide oxidoreductase DCC family protein [Evansella vedderi]MDQ0256498.1 putative DCC family thiol-disulfide oxidoreductase YuxK [Evansella vedderi]
MANIILFDGICNFCNSSVQFIIKRDPKGIFKFASLQSDVGKKLLKEQGIPNDLDSFIYIEGDRYYFKSTAALRVCKKLSGPWNLLYPLIIVPRPIRNFVYDIIAKNRYRWFGKQKECMLPSEGIKKRFLQ